MKNAKWLIYTGALLLGGPASARAAGASSQGSESTGSSATSSQGAATKGGTAAGATEKQPGMAKKGARAKTVVGTIEKVEDNTLTIKSKKESQHLTLSDKTEFLQNGKKVSKDQLKEGEKVRAAFHSGPGGEMEATRITLLPAGKAAHKAPKGGGAAAPGGAAPGGAAPGGSPMGGAPPSK